MNWREVEVNDRAICLRCSTKKSERTENGYGLKIFLRTLPDCCSVCICKQGRLSKNHSLTKTIRFQNEQKESKESVWVGVGAYCLLVAHASAHPV